MDEVLNKIDGIEDLKKLDYIQKRKLAEEIRELIIKTVSKNGGHLASNLGVVELTIALDSVFDVPNDKIIWDVGHQTYSHKILTGRKNEMNTLRQMDGIAGFPKISESDADCFNTGHSSTSISVALGMARARDIKKENTNIIAVIGDGALTGGMAFEALDDAGTSKTNLIVILNDNEMSISQNVGGLSMFLGKVRTKKLYKKSNNYVKKIIKKIPYIGKRIVRFIEKFKNGIKNLVIPNMIFEDMGFTYMGPVDGHDIQKLEEIIKISKKIDGPVLIHVLTKKGKGYKPAEDDPSKFHSTSSFDIETGKALKEKKDDYSKIFGDKLVQLASKNDKIIAITAAMRDGTGLMEFSKKYPNRFFDVGIAEQHAITMAAGMAKAGMVPVVPIYSSFYQRGYDQVIHDVCIQKLHVVLCADRAGIVGNDGETHQGILDLSFLNIVPNLNILAPKDFKELEEMLEFAVNLDSPVFIRYPRGAEEFKFENQNKIEIGKAEIIKEGTDITILAIGKMVARAMEVDKILKENEISAEIINMRFLKPIDEKHIVDSVNKTGKVITIEDNIIKGGLGSSVIEILNKNDISTKTKCFGYPDEFIKHGDTSLIEEKYGLDAKSIANYCISTDDSLRSVLSSKF